MHIADIFNLERNTWAALAKKAFRFVFSFPKSPGLQLSTMQNRLLVPHVPIHANMGLS